MCPAGTIIGLRWSWVCREGAKAFGACGKVWRIELRTCVCKAGEVSSPPSRALLTPITAAVFQENANSVTESARTVGIAQAAPQDKPAAFRTCPGACALAWPGSRYPPCTVAPHFSGPTLWPQHHLMPHLAALQSQMPTLLSLLGLRCQTWI